MKLSRTFSYGDHDVTIETGAVARQADGAVIVTMAETVVLVTAVGQKGQAEGRAFFPLTGNYQGKTFAAGKIPGGFFKREGRPSEKETLTSRLIDRPIRPLFPQGYRNDVQVIATVLSLNPDVNPDIPALIGASASLAISGLPFRGPIAAARVGYKNGEYLLNPDNVALEDSDLDLVVAGTENAVLMVESEANILSEEVMLGAVVFGHEQMQVAIGEIKSLAAEIGKPSIEWIAPEVDEALVKSVEAAVGKGISEAYSVAEKQSRSTQLSEVKKELISALAEDDSSKWTAAQVESEFGRLEKSIVRGRVLDGEARIDGRDTRTVRPITCKSACYREPMDPRYSHAGKPRLWLSRPWGLDAMLRSLMHWRAREKIPSCCTITFLPTALERLVL